MSEPQSKFSLRKMALIVLVIGGVISITLQLTNRTPVKQVPKELAGVLLPSSRPLTDFTLTDHNEKPFDMNRLKDRWTFLFFGYTHCPDICPTALGELAEVFDYLGQHQQILQNSQGVFISVDPARDRPETLKDYVPYFNPDFIGVTGTPKQIKDFSRQLGVFYQASKEKDADGNYQVTHASSFFLINPQGELAAIFQPSIFNAEKISQFFLTIRNM